jgi:DNA repair protein RadC
VRRRRIPVETPANRLFDNGARSLTSAELLGLVLGPAGDDPARRLLDDWGGLARLAQAPLGQLARGSGLSRARLVRLAAALELGRRAAYPSDGHVPCFRSPAEVARYLIARFGNREVEEFGVLMLDSRGCLRRAEIISRGSLTGAPVHPRDLFRLAAAYQAVSLILFHNHPSGDPEPSEADRQLTRRLQEAGAIMGIPVLDHLVIGAGKWHSFSEAGAL